MSTCCETSCPESAAVTVEQNTYQMNSGIVSISETPDSPTQTTVVIQIKDSDGNALEDFFSIGLALVPNNTDPNTLLSSPPASPGWISSGVITAVDGSYTIVFTNPSLVAFYLVVTFAGSVTISNRITVGV